MIELKKELDKTPPLERAKLSEVVNNFLETKRILKDSGRTATESDFAGFGTLLFSILSRTQGDTCELFQLRIEDQEFFALAYNKLKDLSFKLQKKDKELYDQFYSELLSTY